MHLPFVSSLSTAALQVSISLNKVELSVGESKFFICTGTNAAHLLSTVNMCVREAASGSLLLVCVSVNAARPIWWVSVAASHRAVLVSEPAISSASPRLPRLSCQPLGMEQGVRRAETLEVAMRSNHHLEMERGGVEK